MAMAPLNMRPSLVKGAIRASALALLMAMLATAAAAAQDPSPHRAGLVIIHGDGQVVTHCITFAEETISGADLLRSSGLPVVLNPYGGLGYGVCAIDGEGCTSGDDCFCQCRGNPCAYWTYSHRQPDGSWVISGLGASAWQLRDGDVDGWVWGDGTVAPPALDLADICPAEDPPAFAPSAVPTESAPPATPPATAPPPEPAPLPSSYLFFAALLAPLLGGLAWAILRRR